MTILNRPLSIYSMAHGARNFTKSVTVGTEGYCRIYAAEIKSSRISEL